MKNLGFPGLHTMKESLLMIILAQRRFNEETTFLLN